MSGDEKKDRKAHCPTCNGERNCIVHGYVEKPWDWDDQLGHSMNGGVGHSLLECKGCEGVFYESDSWDSESIDQFYGPDGKEHWEYEHTKNTYPKPESKSQPVWLAAILKSDVQLHGILTEMYQAYDSQSNILAAIGLRTALDRGTELLGIDPAVSFGEKVATLESKGLIGKIEREILNVVADAGNAAAHRGWSPSAQDVAQLLSILYGDFPSARIHYWKHGIENKREYPSEAKTT